MSDLSPDPGTPQTADKANVGGFVAGGLLLVALGLVFYFDGKNGTNYGELLLTLAIAIVGGGATHGAVYKTKNRRKHPKTTKKG
jgi:LPXTG-motif cell wall-anchored protein